MKNQEPGKRLQREAFNLIVAVYDDPQRRSTLEAWSKQSPAHEQAIIQAKLDWEVLGQVDDPPLSRLDNIILAIQIRLSNVTDNPIQFVPSFAFAMGFIVAIYFGSDMLFRSEVQPDAVSFIAESEPVTRLKYYRTSVGEQKTIQLEDGSEVWLDWHTELTVSMSESKREVVLLKGKALFSVVADADRPFSVTSENTVATALGTEFVVQRLPNQAVQVEVLKGAVSVQAEDQPTVKHLGMADVVRVKGRKIGQIKSRPIAELGTWRDGILVFEQRPLMEVIEALRPYTIYNKIDTRNVFDSGRLVSGTFVLSKGDDALQAIMQSYHLTGDVDTRNTLFLRSFTP